MVPLTCTEKLTRRRRRIQPGALMKSLLAFMVALTLTTAIAGQSGHRPLNTSSGGVLVGVMAKREGTQTTPVTSKEVAIYDNGVEQMIRNFTPDPSPAKIVLLVDNSLSIA
jgi:hypothetical protein